MNREEFARRIHWAKIIWFFGIVNVTAMVPQLYAILETRNVSGISIWMFVIYAMIQVAFSLEGYFTRNRMLMVCLGLSALMSFIIIGLILYYR